MQIKYMGSIINVNEPSTVNLNPNFVEINPIKNLNSTKIQTNKPNNPNKIKRPKKPIINAGISASAQVKDCVREYLKNNGPSKNTDVLNFIRKHIDISKYSRNFVYVAVLTMKDVKFTGDRNNRIWALKTA